MGSQYQAFGASRLPSGCNSGSGLRSQMLGLPLGAVEGRADARPLHIRDLLTGASLEGRPIATGEHCYGCAAGQGSSCGGALEG